MFSRLSILAFALLCSARLGAQAGASASGARSFPLLYTVAREYDPTAWIRGAERFPRGAQLFIQDAKGRRPLVASFAATADASASFDGSEVLFAGKKRAADHWQIWEISLENGSLRQITQCSDDCVRPLYVPPDRFVYAHKLDGKFALEISVVGAGEPALQLTYAPGNFLPSDVLQDGRILFAAAHPLGYGATSELYTVYTDGSGVEAYRCDHGHARYSGKQLASGDITFAREGHFFRFTSALAHDVAVAAPAGTYAGDVAETPDGVWLLSWHAEGQKNFELVRWRPGARTLLAAITQAGASIIQPIVVASRPVPNRHPSGLHDWSYANVLCLNSYTSKFHFADGSIASVRLYTRDASGASRLLGTAPVEKDGSFYLRVPGDQPLQIELLDQAGRTLQKEAGWFWMRGGEQRVCVGCHTGPEIAPENAVPAVLQRSIVPTDMTRREPSSPTGGH